jgi:hypothetical protein
MAHCRGMHGKHKEKKKVAIIQEYNRPRKHSMLKNVQNSQCR